MNHYSRRQELYSENVCIIFEEAYLQTFSEKSSCLIMVKIR